MGNILLPDQRHKQELGKVCRTAYLDFTVPVLSPDDSEWMELLQSVAGLRLEGHDSRAEDDQEPADVLVFGNTLVKVLHFL